jgi:hypothetical protein
MAAVQPESWLQALITNNNNNNNPPTLQPTTVVMIAKFFVFVFRLKGQSS